MTVHQFNLLKSQFQMVIDRMEAKGMVGVVLRGDNNIESAFSGSLTTQEACEMICRLIQFIFEDRYDQEVEC